MTTYLVTGANRGIGYAYCEQLKARGDEVIGVCRQSSAELDGLGVRVESGIDVSDEKDIAKLQKALGDKPIDVLIKDRKSVV